MPLARDHRQVPHQAGIWFGRKRQPLGEDGVVVIEAEDVAETGEVGGTGAHAPWQALAAEPNEVPIVLDGFSPAVEVGRGEARLGLPPRPPSPAVGPRQGSFEKAR